jgi:thiol-disulfide isomerase/thioredoxin
MRYTSPKEPEWWNGRHARLKSVWGNPCEFESRLRHTVMKKQLPSGVSAAVIASVVVLALVLIGLAPRGGRGGASDPAPSGPRTGSAAPALSGQTTDGKTVSLTDLKGKVVLINFWATWCGPCRQEMPELVALYKKYKERGLVVLSVAADETHEPVDAFLKDSPLPFTVVYGVEDMKRAYAVNSLPTTVLVDKDGQIVFDIDGYDPTLDFGALVEKYL